MLKLTTKRISYNWICLKKLNRATMLTWSFSLTIFGMILAGTYSDTALSQDVSGSQTDAVKVSPRELLILKPGIEKIFGQWVADVFNSTSKPALFEFEPHLPKGVTDFQPVDGVDAKSLKLGADGVVISRVFNPGSNVVSLSFSMPASRHNHDLEIVAERDLTQMLVIVPSGFLSLTSDQLSFQNIQPSDGENFAVYQLVAPISKGSLLKFSVSGIPESRGRLWYVGAVFAAILAVGTLIVILRSGQTVSKQTK